MFKLFDTVYYASPPTLQNLMVSAYGYCLRGKRYGKDFTQVMNELEEVRAFSSEQVLELTQTRLQAMMLYAAKEIPYYINLFSQSDTNPFAITTVAELAKLPILEKATLRQIPKMLLPADIDKRSYTQQHTSGSTGTPLKIDTDRQTYRLAMALVADHERLHGVAMGERRATFAGRMVQETENTSPPFWRYNRAENQMLFSAYHLNEERAPLYVKELNLFQPKEIIGYPSAIYALAVYMAEQQLTLEFQPPIVVTNSETLFEWQREVIESSFGCKIFDYYGTAEYVVFAGQCAEGRYHINPLIGIIEVVDDNDLQVVDKAGDIVCTTLSNHAMPLIRYRIGDRGVLSGTACHCGCNYQVLDKIEGRIDDVVITKDGRKIGRLDHIFKGVTGIRECQLVQNSLDNFVLNVVKGKSFDKATIDTIKSNLLARVGPVSLKVVFMTNIPKTDRGKFKGVVNKIQ